MGRRRRFGLAVACSVAIVLQTTVLTLGPAPAGAGVAQQPTELPPPLLRSWAAPDPADIDIGPDGNVYVVDGEGCAVEVYSPTGTLLRRWDVPPPVARSEGLTAIAVAGTGDVFVADGDDRIRRYDQAGQLLSTWGGDAPSEPVYGSRGLAATAGGNVLVADASAVRELSAEGQFVREWGQDSLTTPSEVDVDAAGAVYISDFHGITRWTAEGQRDPAFAADFYFPIGVVAAGPDGHVYGINGNAPWYRFPTEQATITEVDAAGAPVTHWGSAGPAELQFRRPAIAVAGDGTVFVADRGNGRIKAFARVPRPDLRIRQVGVPRYTGDQLYNADATLQRVSLSADAGERRSFRVSLQNDAPLDDSIVVQGPASGAGFQIRYEAAGADVTEPVVDGSYVVDLPPGGATTLDLTLAVDGELEERTVDSSIVTVRSAAMPDRLDTVGISVVSCPRGCAGSAVPPLARSSAYVAMQDLDRVVPVDLGTGRAGAPIEVGDFPVAMVASPDGRTVYVANDRGRSITPIDVTTNTTRADIPIDGNPRDLAITPDGKRLLVAAGRMYAVTLATGTVERMAVGASAVEISPDGRTAYVGNGGVVAVDLASGVVGNPTRAGDYLIDLAVAPDGKGVYAASGSWYWSRGIRRIDTVNFREVWGKPAGVAHYGDLAVAPDSSRVFLTDAVGVSGSAGEHGLLRVFSADRGRRRAVPVDDPFGIAVTADAVLVGNHSNRTITPFDLDTLRPGRPIPVGGRPTAIVAVADRQASRGSSGAT